MSHPELESSMRKSVEATQRNFNTIRTVEPTHPCWIASALSTTEPTRR